MALIRGSMGSLHVKVAASIRAASSEWGPPGFTHLLRAPTFFHIDKWGGGSAPLSLTLDGFHGGVPLEVRGRMPCGVPPFQKAQREDDFWVVQPPYCCLLFINPPILKKKRHWHSRLWERRGVERVKGHLSLDRNPLG